VFEATLKGQVALVTGGSRGIGRATVLALAQAGADVVLSYSSQADTRAGHPGIADATADEARALGVRALTLEADVADPASAQVMIDSTVEGLGRLDIVVNNAGIARDNLAIRMTNAEWDLVIAIDLSAAFHVCRAALKPMLRQRSGRLINVSSIAGIMGNPGQANYSAAKAGLIGLTKTLAREVGSRGITVNAVAPGFIETDMTAALGDKVLNSALGAIPLGRAGKAEDVAAAIRFLALPEAGYITGCVLQIDGGMGA
jgi:3-oxoacyl-[acyl-carrier protein] reductase